MSEIENGSTIILTKRSVAQWLAFAGFALPLIVSVVGSFVTYRIFVAETQLALNTLRSDVIRLHAVDEERGRYVQSVERRLGVIEGKLDIIIQRENVRR